MNTGNVSYEQLRWSCACLALALIPHLPSLPLWIPLTVAASGAIRLVLAARGRGPPPQVLRLGIAAAAVVLAVTAYAIAPRSTAAAGPAVSYAQVAPIVAARCAVCHAAHPTYAGFAVAPAGVLLDTPAQIVANAPRIRAQAVATHAMPLGNLTHITDAERVTLGAWIDAGAKGP